MEKLTLGKSARLVEGWRNRTEEATKWALKVFMHFIILEAKGIWQREDYYEAAKERNKYIKLPFTQFLVQRFKIKKRDFLNVKQLLTLKEGKEIFLRHGGNPDNIVTYLNSDIKQRPRLIKEAEKRIIPQPLRYVKKELEENNGITKDKTKDKKKVGRIEDAEVLQWKKKYEKAQKRVEELKEQVESLEKALAHFALKYGDSGLGAKTIETR